MKAIWNLVCRLFTRDRVAKVWRILFDGAVTAGVALLTNKELMDAAFNISLSILGLKGCSTGIERAEEFDARMMGWCEAHGVKAPSRSEMNAIREIAYAAVKANAEAKTMCLPSGKL